jgi:hypothetical protein
MSKCSDMNFDGYKMTKVVEFFPMERSISIYVKKTQTIGWNFMICQHEINFIQEHNLDFFSFIYNLIWRLFHSSNFDPIFLNKNPQNAIH